MDLLQTHHQPEIAQKWSLLAAQCLTLEHVMPLDCEPQFLPNERSCGEHSGYNLRTSSGGRNTEVLKGGNGRECMFYLAV
jgi:hypothetical protein